LDMRAAPPGTARYRKIAMSGAVAAVTGVLRLRRKHALGCGIRSMETPEGVGTGIRAF